MNEFFEVIIGNSKMLDKDAKTQPEHNENTVFESYEEAFAALCAYYKRQFGDAEKKVKLRLESGACTINQLSFDAPEEEEDEVEEEVAEEEAAPEEEEEAPAPEPEEKKKKGKKKKE